MNAKESRWKRERLLIVAPVSDGIFFTRMGESPFDRLRLRQPSNSKSVRHHYCAGTNTVIIDARNRLILMVVLASIVFGNSSLHGVQLQLLEFRKGELLGVEQVKEHRLAIIAQGVQNRVYITTAALSPDSSEIEVPKGPRLYVDRPVMSVSTAAFESNLYLGLILHNGNAERIFWST